MSLKKISGDSRWKKDRLTDRVLNFYVTMKLLKHCLLCHTDRVIGLSLKPLGVYEISRKTFSKRSLDRHIRPWGTCAKNENNPDWLRLFKELNRYALLTLRLDQSSFQLASNVFLFSFSFKTKKEELLIREQ